MPTRAELPLHDITYSEANSWTDALPVCRESAVGSSINQIYREDGNRQHFMLQAKFCGLMLSLLQVVALRGMWIWCTHNSLVD
ncbi:hypothetical protein RUM43_012614 [Polyplax serrata]|uniref:Uncharacterized protein n=1 Tax=Polyplax serrata TaxID=468196 RepID=A0AAN8Q2Z6_POLSC